jgi:SPP1 gp7 family putative phage head morphogenesis protein
MLKELLLLQQRSKSPKKRKINPVRNLNWLFPFALERQYAREISKIMKELTAMATEGLRDNLNNWIEENKLLTDKKDGYKKDAFSDDIKQIIKNLLVFVRNKTPQARTLLSTMSINISDQNLSQWKRFTKKLVGVEVFGEELWEEEALKAWQENNLNLITGLTQEYAKKYSDIISKGLQFGETASSMAKKIARLNKGMTTTRAQLIARDQVASLHGQMTKQRQLDAGIDKYIWQIVGDERVRGKPGGRYPTAVPSHHLMSGTINKWSDNTVYSDDGEEFKKRTAKMPKAIPGEEINCRCSALPFFEDLIDEVNANIENDKKFVLNKKE